ncbi:MAG: WD40 repeat domain-containing protein [Candidatus Aminicenantes bacterium]|nr:WD40 repeat domain-containing protein [Candidatus Aminicenantes bacterium]
MSKKTVATLALALLAVTAALAVVPQKWTFRVFDDFLRGKFDGVSLASDGRLTLSPREEGIDGPTEDFYLSVLMTPEGIAYLGTGHGGRIYRISKDGKSELYAQTSEMDVTSLAMDKKGVLYAGTSPNGKIYKITAQSKSADFFDPSEKYIWDLHFLEDGNLLAAVGESGGIYEVNPQGEGRMTFKAQENHILCLKLDKTGDIIAGSGGNGLVYRIAKGGKAAVIFESPYEEVRSLAFDLDGNIYAAAGGTTSRGKKEDLLVPAAGRDAEVMISISATAAAPATQAVQAARAPGKPAPAVASSLKEPGALYRIAPNGVATRLWSSSDEMIYSLFWNEPEKRIYFGTGPKGRLVALDKDEKATLVLQKNSEQIFDLLPVGVRTYLLSNNPVQLSVIYPEQRLSGEYISPVLDARILSTWGKMSWDVDLPEGALVQFQTRSGNSYEPGPSWSDWSPPYQKREGEQILSPKARYLQFRALFKAISGKQSPVLSKAVLFYLQTNVAPVFSRLEALTPNEVFLKMPDQEEIIQGLEKRAPDAAAKKDDGLRFAMPKKVERKGYQTIQWDTEDENGDSLLYTISLRQEGEKDWRVLEDGWAETLFTLATTNFPDGVYFLKVTASDLPSNPPALEKTAEKISQALVIDNSPPQVKNVLAVRDGTQLNVSFLAEDAFSPIKDVRYLVRPDDWRVVFPEDGICDSKQESFKFKIALAGTSDKMITILVKDAAGNTATIKQAF